MTGGPRKASMALCYYQYYYYHYYSYSVSYYYYSYYYHAMIAKKCGDKQVPS